MIHDEVTRAAIWFVRNRRELGVTLPEIACEVTRAYERRGHTPKPPTDHYPDTVTEWIADCWETFGLHYGDTPETTAEVVRLPHKGRAK